MNQETRAKRIKRLYEEHPGGVSGKLIGIISEYIGDTYYSVEIAGSEEYYFLPEQFTWDLTAKMLYLMEDEVKAYFEEYKKTGRPPVLWESEEWNVPDYPIALDGEDYLQ